MKTTTPFTLLLLASASLSQAVTTANLLADPGFETQGTLPSFSGIVDDFSINPTTWGAENGSFTGTADSVNPLGTRMHSMLASGVATQTIQIVNLAPYVTDIAAGNATFDISAMFDFGNNASGASAYVAARFFTGGGWSSLSGTTTNSLLLDDDTNNWEQISHSGPIPTNATWMGLELGYNSNSLNGNAGYVDDASLTVTTIPEPSSALLLGLSSLGILLRRKRS